MTTTDPAPAPAPSVSRTVFTAAWMAIALGLAVQALLLTVKAGAGLAPARDQLFVDVAGGVTWSLVVCAGVAIGTVAARSPSATMGALGFVCAPLAFAAAKGVQRGVQWVLGQPMDKVGALVLQTGLVKAIEYAALGYVLGRLIRTPASTPRTHALVGLGFGLIFGIALLLLNAHHAPDGRLPVAKLIGVGLNELVFPIGCSMVIYWVAKLSDRGAALERAVAGGG